MVLSYAMREGEEMCMKKAGCFEAAGFDISLDGGTDNVQHLAVGPEALGQILKVLHKKIPPVNAFIWEG